MTLEKALSTKLAYVIAGGCFALWLGLGFWGWVIAIVLALGAHAQDHEKAEFERWKEDVERHIRP